MMLQSESSLCGIIAEEDDFFSRTKETHLEKLLSTRVIFVDISMLGYLGMLIFGEGARRHERNLLRSFSWLCPMSSANVENSYQELHIASDDHWTSYSCSQDTLGIMQNFFSKNL